MESSNLEQRGKALAAGGLRLAAGGGSDFGISRGQPAHSRQQPAPFPFVLGFELSMIYRLSPAPHEQILVEQRRDHTTDNWSCPVE